MAEFPSLPLFTDAYLGDTTHLTTFEHGAYMLLLIVSWRSTDCCLPDDDKLLARYTRMTLDKWRKTRAVLAPFFTIKNGCWHQARLQDELQHLRSQRAQQSAAGKASVKAKALKRLNRDATDVEAPLQRDVKETSTPTPDPLTIDKSMDGKPSNNGPEDPVKNLFDLGILILTSAGNTEKQARSLIGKWREGGKRDAEVLVALMECRTKLISEPVEWLTKRLKPAQFVSKTGYQYKGSLESIIRESEKRADWNTHWAAKRKLEEQNGKVTH